MSNDCYNPMLPQDKAYFNQLLADLHTRVFQLENLRLPHLQRDNFVTSVTLQDNSLVFEFVRTGAITVELPPQIDVAAAIAANPTVQDNTAARHTHANLGILDATTAPYTVTRDAEIAQLLLDIALKADAADLSSYALLTDLVGYATAGDLASYVHTSDSRLSDSREWSAATVSQLDAEAGTSTDRFAWTPERVKQAILALAPSGGGGGGSATAGRHTIPIMAGSMQPSASGGSGVLTNIATAANQPDVQTLNFHQNTQQHCQFAIPFPKRWNKGTITARFRWSHAATTTNFGVVWGIQAVAVGDNEAINQAYGTAVEVTDTGGTTNRLYVSDETSAFTVANTPTDGDTIFFRIYRKAADAADTLAIVARLHGVDLFVTTDAENDA